MAKYERSLTGKFDDLLNHINSHITGNSLSAQLEDGSDLTLGPVRLAVRVYERYSMVGQNRVSLSITLAGQGNQLYVSAITSGGSQAVFCKLNTFGEHTFLEQCIESIEQYASGS